MVRVYRVESVRYPGQRATDPDIGLLLDRKGDKWDDGGVMRTVVPGSVYRANLPPVACDVAIWVMPKQETNARKSSKHRVMCECPGCGKTLSVGRLRQHRCE